MGCFDTFHNRDETLSVQLKNGYCLLDHYTEGETVNSVEFPDAVYHGNEGVVVIWGGAVLCVSKEIPDGIPDGLMHCDKWVGPTGRSGAL